MGPVRYQISVRGRLTERLGSAFAGMTMEPGAGQTVLVGEIRDQSHLYGILDRVRSLGLELVSVEPFRADQASDQDEGTGARHAERGNGTQQPGCCPAPVRPSPGGRPGPRPTGRYRSAPGPRPAAWLTPRACDRCDGCAS